MTTFLFQCYVFCISFIVSVYADLSALWQVLNCPIGLTCAAWSSAANAPKPRTEEQSRAMWRWLPTWPQIRSSRAAWQGDSRVAASKGALFRLPVPLGAATKPCMGWLWNLAGSEQIMNLKLITKHTNASFKHIHIVQATVWCRRLFIMDKFLFGELKNNIDNIYRVYGRQCFHFRLVFADITYSARVQIEHAKSVIDTKYPQPITHTANPPFRVR